MFKIIPELANFVLTYRNNTLDIKLAQFNFHFHEKSNERIITVSRAGNPDHFVSFFVNNETDGEVIFADNMTPKERQSLYSRVRAFVKKNYVSLPKTQYKVNRFCVFCETETLYTIRNKKKINVAVVAERRGVYHILHDPDVDVMRFVESVGDSDSVSDGEREHKIEDNFDIVENMTNTDENNHGGNSKADEVEGARRGDGSIDGDGDSGSVGGSDSVSASTASAPDTAEDTAGDDTADGFQDARGGFGGDPQNSHPADDSASCETADSERNGGVGSIGARVDTEDAQEESIGGEGGPQPLIVEEGEEGEEDSGSVSDSDSGSVGGGDDPKSLVEAFLDQREFNKPYRGEGLDIDTELFVKGETLDDRVVRRLTTTFKKHFIVSSLGRETPALDKKLLIKRLVSFRSPYTAFKRDLANQTILVLVDTSPSMSNFTPLMPYFWKITKILKDLIVIENTNMIPVRIYENGKMKTLGDAEFDRYMNEEQAVRFYNDFMRKHDISTIVNFTDFDGLDITELLLEKTNAEMIILDVYKCRVLNYIPKKAKNWEGLPSKLYRFRDRISYWYGVGDFWGVVKVLNEEL